MPDLSEEQKLFVVQHLATWHTPTQVVNLLQETFNVKATTQQICAYNPETIAGKRLSPELVREFTRTRKAFTSKKAEIPITHRNYRLRKLQDILDHPTRGQAPSVVMAVLELYEKIEGGMFQRPLPKEDPLAKSGATALSELRKLLGVPLTAPEAGPIEAAEREERRKAEREEAAAAEELENSGEELHENPDADAATLTAGENNAESEGA